MSSRSSSPIMDTLTEIHQQSFHWALTCCQHQESEALDVLQEAYVMVLENRVEYRGQSTVKTWFFGIIKNLAFQNGRRFKRRLKLLQNAFIAHHPALAASSVTKDDPLEFQERQQRIAQALKKLSARQERIMHLVFYQGCTLEESALILELSVGSVRTHYARAKAKLAQSLSDLKSPFVSGERISSL